MVIEINRTASNMITGTFSAIIGFYLGYSINSIDFDSRSMNSTVSYKLKIETLEAKVQEGDNYSVSIDAMLQRIIFVFDKNKIYSFFHQYGLTDEKGASYSAEEFTKIIAPLLRRNAKPRIKLTAIPLGKTKNLEIYDVINININGVEYTRYCSDK